MRKVGARLDTPMLVLPPDVASPKHLPHDARPPGDWGRFILRFIAKIEVVPNDPDGCWLWTGAKSKSGDGTSSIGGRNYGAHRIAYRVFIGPVPNDMDVLRTCRVNACVRKHHLRLGNAAREALAKYGPVCYRVSPADLALIEAREAAQQQ